MSRSKNTTPYWLQRRNNTSLGEVKHVMGKDGKGARITIPVVVQHGKTIGCVDRNVVREALAADGDYAGIVARSESTITPVVWVANRQLAHFVRNTIKPVSNYSTEIVFTSHREYHVFDSSVTIKNPREMVKSVVDSVNNLLDHVFATTPVIERPAHYISVEHSGVGIEHIAVGGRPLDGRTQYLYLGGGYCAKITVVVNKRDVVGTPDLFGNIPTVEKNIMVVSIVHIGCIDTTDTIMFTFTFPAMVLSEHNQGRWHCGVYCGCWLCDNNERKHPYDDDTEVDDWVGKTGLLYHGETLGSLLGDTNSSNDDGCDAGCASDWFSASGTHENSGCAHECDHGGVNDDDNMSETETISNRIVIPTTFTAQ